MGRALGVGMANSVTTPAGVISPILSAAVSVKKRLPSGPFVIPVVSLADGTEKTLRDIKLTAFQPLDGRPTANCPSLASGALTKSV